MRLSVSIWDEIFCIKKISFVCEHTKSPVYFKRNYDNTDFITMELFIISCCIFFMIFLPFGSFLTQEIVLNVNFPLLFTCPLRSQRVIHCSSFILISGSCPRNPMISVNCFQSFCSSFGESAMQDSFWRRFISCLKSVIDIWNNKVVEVYKSY